MARPPLIQELKSMIERSYGMAPVIPDLAPFIVGDAGYLARYGNPAGRGHDALPRARLMVRDAGPAVRVALYYPDVLVRHLERFNPLAALGEENIEAFAVLVEELDHLLTLASRAAERRPVSLLELEHHANVTKYLVVMHFLGKQSGRRRVPEPLRRWARHHLLERYSQGKDEEAVRYREAARLAGQYIDYLATLPPGGRHTELRAYQRRPLAETVRLLINPN